MVLELLVPLINHCAYVLNHLSSILKQKLANALKPIPLWTNPQDYALPAMVLETVLEK